MSQIRFFSSEQENLIPQIQAKWQEIYLSTERIDRDRAREALKEIYTVMGKSQPEIIFCDSPQAALERLETYIAGVKIPETTNQSPEEMMRGVNIIKFFAKALIGTVRQNNKRKKAETRVIYDLVEQISAQPNKSLVKHIDKSIPKDLTTQQVVEQSFLDLSRMLDILEKQPDLQGEKDFLKTIKTIQTKSIAEWQESFSVTASNIDRQLARFPGKRFFFRKWLKGFLLGTIISNITGIEYPKLKETVFSQISFPQRKFLSENMPVITSDLVPSCIWLDFAFSVLNYPCKLRQWEVLQKLVQNCGWIFATDNICFICDRPTKILIDEDRQLHGEGEPALEYADGYAAYAYKGLPLPEKYGAIPPEEWQSEWVLAEANKHLQKALIQGIGVVRLCQELSLIELEKAGEYTLFKLDENTGTQATYILQRIDAETEEIKAVLLPWTSSCLNQAIQYANESYSAEDFPLT